MPDNDAIPVITDEQELLRYGVCRAAIPCDKIPLEKWATELSRVTPLNMAQEDGEYAFYRNILDEPDFPFDAVLDSEIGKAIFRHFGVTSFTEIRLDDAFCIHYNTTQQDTSGAKHMDPSDITVNMCLESSGVTGSEVKFYGTPQLENTLQGSTDIKSFLVKQEAGFATIHWGRHPHSTMPLTTGRRTNIVLTYCYTDPNKSGALMRTCYDTQN